MNLSYGNDYILVVRQTVLIPMQMTGNLNRFLAL